MRQHVDGGTLVKVDAGESEGEVHGEDTRQNETLQARRQDAEGPPAGEAQLAVVALAEERGVEEVPLEEAVPGRRPCEVLLRRVAEADDHAQVADEGLDAVVEDKGDGEGEEGDQQDGGEAHVVSLGDLWVAVHGGHAASTSMRGTAS